MLKKKPLKLMAVIFGLVIFFHLTSTTPSATIKGVQDVKKPLLFIANEGQFDDEVAFYANPMGLEVFVTKKGEIVYSLQKKDKEGIKISSFKETLIRTPLVSGRDRHEAVFNYFIGNDKSKWKSNVPSYSSVDLGEVAEGIRLKLKATEGNIEKLFYLSPKADPKDILIKTSGGKLKINDKGELIVDTALGEITFTKPIAYQEIDGKKVDVKVSYRLATDAYGFSVGEYEKTKELIIDPLLASRFVGGTQGEAARAIASDAGGNIFIAGDTAESGSFPKMPGGVYNCTTCNGRDITVSKFDHNLVMLASTFIGGNNEEWCDDIVIWNGVDVYLIGSSLSSNFPMPGTPYQSSLAGNRDAVIAWFSNDLATLNASTYLGGSGWDKAFKGASTYIGGSVLYITGETESTNFPTTTGVYQTTHGGGKDAFVSLLSANLSLLMASTYLGKNGEDFASGIVSAGTAGVSVVGSTNSNDFPATYGSYSGGYDGFICWLSADLRTLNQSRLIGHTGDDHIQNIITYLGNFNILYISGYTNSSTANFGYTTDKFYGSGGSNDVFIMKLSYDLSTVNVTAGIGGTSDEGGMEGGVPIATNGPIFYVGGRTNSNNFPTTTGAYRETPVGLQDGFIAKFDSDLNRLSATYIGGTDSDEVVDLVFANGSIYACGETASNDFPTTMTPGFGGLSDQFVLKFDPDISAPSANYTLTVTKAGTGTGTVNAAGCVLNWIVNTGTCSISSGYEVTLSATADVGSFFAGFIGGGCVGSGDCLVTMNSNKHVTATFQLTGTGGVITLPQTGQTLSYDTNVLKRDDGALRTGLSLFSMRFITGVPGTVIDRQTGLMWMAAGNTPTINPCTIGGAINWALALDYVTCLNNNNYLGYSDWRLPNVNEMASLLNVGVTNTATWLNTQGFTSIPTSTAWYWTSTTDTANTTQALAVATDNGSFISDPKTGTNYAIAVRQSSYSPVLSRLPRTGQTISYDPTRHGEDGDIQAGEPFPTTRFVDDTNTNITIDNLTGLKWPKAANTPTIGSCTGGAMTWQGAINYINCLNNNSYLGYSDWRLPNKNELKSLMFYGTANPALPAGHLFTGVQSIYWSSTTNPANTLSAYTVNFNTGLLSNVLKTNSTPYVIPVRGGFISVTVIVTGGGTVKGIDNPIDCGIAGNSCMALVDYRGDSFLRFSLIPNTGKTLNNLIINGLNIGPVHSIKVRSATHYVDIQAQFSP